MITDLLRRIPRAFQEEIQGFSDTTVFKTTLYTLAGTTLTNYLLKEHGVHFDPIATTTFAFAYMNLFHRLTERRINHMKIKDKIEDPEMRKLEVFQNVLMGLTEFIFNAALMAPGFISIVSSISGLTPPLLPSATPPDYSNPIPTPPIKPTLPEGLDYSV